MVDRTVKKSGNASPLVMGFASFKIVYIFIISDVSAKAQGKTQIAAKSLSQGAFQLHILLPCRRLPGRGQELLHVPAHGGVVLLLSPRLLTLGGQRRPPFFIRVWDIPASDFYFRARDLKMGKIRKCGYTCCACYRFFSLLIKRYGHLKIPAKEQKKTQKIEATLHLL